MRESGENPEQYPLPYVREAAVRGVSRSLGTVLRRRSVGRGASCAPHRTSRKTYDESRWACVSMPENARGKVGRGRENLLCRGFLLQTRGTRAGGADWKKGEKI